MTTLKLSELLRYRLGGDTLVAPAGGYVYHQNTPSAYWVINHNLGQKYVVVEVINNSDLAQAGRYDYPVIDFVDNNTLTVTFSYLTTGHVVLAAGSVKGEKGDSGNIVVAGSYVHNQPYASATWNINHNLGQKYVVIDLIDQDDTVITGRYDHPTITYINENSIQVAFDRSIAGKAVVSIGGGANVSIQSGANVFLGNGNLTVGTIGNLFTTTYTGGTYGDANVAAYLPTYTGNIAASYLLTDNIRYANGQPYSFGSTYSNANVAAYLPTDSTIVALKSNVASFGASFGTVNANINALYSSNISTQANIGAFYTYANTRIQTISSNLGAYQTYANSVNGFTQANIGYFQTYANTSISSLYTNAATQATSITTLQTQVYSNANVASYLPTYSGNIAANIVKNGYTWTFGTDGALTLPASSGQIGRSGYTNGIDLYNDNGGTGYVRMNYADESFVWADSGGAHIQTSGANTWDFGTDANLTLPSTGYLRVGTGIVAGFASSPAPIISGFSSVSAENFRFLGNGVNILSTVAGTYSNANVAAYLPTYNGNIAGTTNGYTLGYIDIPQNAQSGSSYTLALSDRGKHVYGTNSSTANIVIPPNSSVAFPIGTSISIVSGSNTGSITVSPSGGITLLLGANTTATGTRTISSYGMATLIKTDTNTWYISGAGVS